MVSIFQGAPSDFLCKKREQAPKAICRYQTKTEHFKSMCAPASDFPCSLAWSASGRNERSHLVLLSLHPVWREELSLSLLLVIVMSLESHQIGVNQFVFVFLSSLRHPSVFWIGRVSRNGRGGDVVIWGKHVIYSHPFTGGDLHVHLHLCDSKSGTWKKKELVSYSCGTRLCQCSHHCRHPSF